MGLELHTEIGPDGRKTVVIEDTVDAEVAWQTVKWLENLNQKDYPLVLDLSRARSIHWLAIEILKNGVQSLNRKTGPIYLRLNSEATRSHRQP